MLTKYVLPNTLYGAKSEYLKSGTITNGSDTATEIGIEGSTKLPKSKNRNKDIFFSFF